MEFVYTRQLDREELAPPVFLGLAEIRVQQGNLPAALELLRRLTLVVGEPFDHLAASGALLERLNRPAEALEFRRARVQAVPWDAEAHIALARAEIAAARDRAGALDRLRRMAESPKERYAVRVEAARAFASAGGVLGRPPQTEIDWLRARSDLTPAAADRPMFVAARLAAAERATDAVGSRHAAARGASRSIPPAPGSECRCSAPSWPPGSRRMRSRPSGRFSPAADR